ncbi:MAG TPA: PorV/PorQ family protein [bacterium]
MKLTKIFIRGLILLILLMHMAQVCWADSKFMPYYFITQTFRPNDPQSAALGLTGVAYRNGVAASLTNPAGLAYLRSMTIEYSHIPSHGLSFWAENDEFFNQEAFAMGIPVTKKLAVGFHYFNLNYGKVGVVDVEGNLLKESQSGLRQLQLSFAQKLNFTHGEEFAFGANAKYLSEYFPFLHRDAYLLDLGLRYIKSYSRYWISVGLSVNNLGTDLKYNQDNSSNKEELVKLTRLGFAIGTKSDIESKRNDNIDFIFSTEYQQNFANAKYYSWQHVGLGLEINLFKHLFGRLGYNFDLEKKDNDEKYDGFTYGMGFETPTKVKIIIPVRISCSYGRGIKYGAMDVNIVSVSLGVDLKN